MLTHTDKIVITGAAGLVGQNLVLLLQEQGYTNLLCLDKNPANLKQLQQLNPNVTIITADLSIPGEWMDCFANAAAVVCLHAQITGLELDEFNRNNLSATENMLAVIKQHRIPYLVHISSSVVNSKANDFYTATKIAQEKLVRESGIKHCVLRPTLMFGWFDPKHLGWLAGFMQRTPFFPIPNQGKYIRQPLYSRDFCRIILAALQQQPDNQVYDIVGNEQVYYIDLIKMVKTASRAKTRIIKIPYHLFYWLLKIYALFDHKPPFTADQLKALTAGDFFTGIDPETVFNVKLTPLSQAITETFQHPLYSQMALAGKSSEELHHVNS